jgi:hypothetical protein
VRRADVANGSSTSFRACVCHFRFGPISQHFVAAQYLSRWANSGLMQAKKSEERNWITSNRLGPTNLGMDVALPVIDQAYLSTAVDPEFFRRTALLTCEREILEFPAEQNWCDTDNSHFHSALRTRRRSPCLRWYFLTSHVISFRRSEATDIRTAASFALKPGHNADAPRGKRRVAADLRPRAPAAHT